LNCVLRIKYSLALDTDLYSRPPSQPASTDPPRAAQAPELSSTELPTRLSSVAEPSTADVKGKRKRDEEDEGEDDELAILDAKIESLKSARKVCRDDWKGKEQEAKRLREEADAAMGRMLDMGDELESLEGQRRKLAGKKRRPDE